MEIIEQDALLLWKKALSVIREKGVDYKDNDGRTCRELLNLVMVLKKPSLESVEEPINIITNTRNWIYPTKEELSNIMFKEYQAPIYDYTYGGRIFNFSGQINQLNSFIIPLLKEDSASRRAIMVLYNPLIDSDISNRNTPGIIYIHFRIKDKKLNMTCAIRSNDIFFGWPANLFQIFNLHKLVANELNVEMGEIVTISNSAHFFLENTEFLKKIIGV